ncbi:hypothetical protein F938_01190 [Acinetobacter bereziniae LMG 1003 = CIP 70.12]|uniref:Uncharacterized protein n=1 Tax=Acinetobacter bereziniae LMG 1003 = CIP 70.12 TaxID=981324 RepID=N9DJZ1_ACIBZ|nr:hypothetical protein [Acinetobacter bereziniae]ENV98131.1 hypothetical protein F938_01190 [Acinetobacter bereziniae LMG 1003 = CIP 70.12]MBJ9907491.1 hypothetical protein [Acinetobacter bereziniae]MBJ9928716.1 hypothetical protein [Acinetobacter bereziniae]QQC81775.1 hypothetical protein I9192_06810 [Acinetobacter bereziniae]
MNNIVQFSKTKTFSSTKESVQPLLDLSDPQLVADMGRADKLVTYDINAMSIDELRDHVRCSIIQLYKDRMHHKQECNTFKSIYRLFGAFLERRCKEELKVYRDSNGKNLAAEGKALAFDEALNTLPITIGTTYATEMR